LPSMIETALYRVVHEAITNVLKHARAQTVVIRAERRPTGIACSVHDDGVGFDVAAVARRPDPGLGLIGIRNRVEALGGTVDIVSGAGRGTQLLIGIPLA